MKSIGKIELYAYIAGLVDGEGSIELRRVRNGERRKFRGFEPRIRISLKKGKEVLEQLRKETGFGSCSRHARNCLCWSIWNREAVELLKKIYPYLRIKKKHAEIIFKLREVQEKRKKGVIKGERYTEEQKKEMERLFLEMRKVNKRGD